MHIPVLLGESIELLKIDQGDIVVDATLGSGGHSLEIARRVGDGGKVIAIDVDKNAIEDFEKRLNLEYPELRKRFSLIHGNFADLGNHMKDLGIKKVDGILADLGWRIEQIRDGKYGMSFQEDSKLDMRMGGDKTKEGAFEIINGWEVERLERLFREFGQEDNAKRIAKEIERKRKESLIVTTKELAGIVEGVAQYRKKGLHPATKIFQALRIVVNNELENLEKMLVLSIDLLSSKGRIAVISFHSLEDRIVKRFFQANARGCVCPKEFPVCICTGKQKIKLISKKYVGASADEIVKNPRSRSARLRVAERL